MMILCTLIIFMWQYDAKRYIKLLQDQQEAWGKERKDLLSRIQARDLNEYTANVVREKKAEQPKDEMNYDEFVS
jgi:hypothetical protein